MRSVLICLAATGAALLLADASQAGCRTVGHAGFRGGFGYGYGANVAFVPSFTYAVPVPVQVPVPVPVAPVPPLALVPADVPACPSYAAPALVPGYSFTPSVSIYGGFGFNNVSNYGYGGRGVRFAGRGVRGFNTGDGNVNQQRGLVNLNLGGGGGGNVNQQRGVINLKAGGGGGGGNVNQQRGLINLKLF